MKRFFILALSCSLLVACGGDGDTDEHAQPEKAQTAEVHKAPLTKSLYLPGTIQPLVSQLVTSPVDGEVHTANVHYGEVVQKGQSLLVVASDQFQKDFSQALTSYLKAKDQYDQSKSKLDSSEELFNDGLISENEITSARSTYYNNNLALLEATESLDKLLHIKELDINIKELDIKDTSAIDKMLNTHKHSQLIEVKSPVNGVVLEPTAKAVGDAKDARVLEINAPVKKNQAILAIGDMRGITVDVMVGEVDINQVKVGQGAKVSAIAFPGNVLKGKVTRVGTQAKKGQGGQPQFTCQISVDKLTDKEAAFIHVGMSAKVEILMTSSSQVLVPIAAVRRENGQSVVTVTRDDQQFTVPVETGDTSTNSVAIIHGLQPGDEVVVPD